MRFQVCILATGLGVLVSQGALPPDEKAGKEAPVAECLQRVREKLAEESFRTGRLRLDSDDWEGAAMAFGRTLSLDPEHSRARLELARVYFHLGRDADARREFDRVLDAQPPQIVRDNIMTYLDLMDSRRRHFALRGKAVAGVLHNDNVNLGTDMNNLRVAPFYWDGKKVDTLPVGPRSRPREAFGTFGYVTVLGDWDFGAKNSWGMQGRLGLYRNRLDRSREHEVGYYDVSLGPRWTGARTRVRGALGYELAELGGERLMDVYAAEPVVLERCIGSWRAVCGVRLEFHDYVRFSERDSVVEELNLYATGKVCDGRLTARIGAVGFRELSRSAVFSNSGLYPSIGLGTSVGSFFDLYVDGRVRSKWYDTRPVLLPEDRRDDRVQLAVTCRRRLWKRLEADLSYQYLQNQSTFDLYDYTRNLTTLSLLTTL